MNEIFPSNVFFTWDIHYKCNYYCTYCFLHFEPETTNIKAVYLEPEKWIEVWQNIYRRYGPCHILVTGGEPFTYPNFIDLISELSKVHSFEFSTNLSWDADEFMKKVSSDRVRINSSFHPEFVSIKDFINKVSLLKRNNYSVSITVVAYPPLLREIVGYKTEFEKERFNLIIYPYRGPCQDRKFPEEYTDREKDILKELGSSTETEANKELFNIWVDKQRVENLEKLCRMGQRYAKIIPDGNAYRCCPAVHKDWGGLGNIVDNTFNLLSEPAVCLHYQNCVCFKAMIVGEEDKWLKHWNTIKNPLEVTVENRILDIVKILQNEATFDETIEKLINENPTSSIKSLILSAEVYIDEKKYDSADRTLQVLLEKSQNSAYLSWIYRCLGRLNRESLMNKIYDNDNAEKQRRFALALSYLDKAIKLADENVNHQDKFWAIYEKAYVYYLEKNYPLAKETIKILLTYEPENKYFKELLGNIEALR